MNLNRLTADEIQNVQIGDWNEREALDISSQAHQAIALPSLGVLLFRSESEVYFTFDTSANVVRITEVSNESGSARFTCSADHGLSTNDYVCIYNCDEQTYNVMTQITEVTGEDAKFDTSISYVSNDSGYAAKTSDGIDTTNSMIYDGGSSIAQTIPTKLLSDISNYPDSEVIIAHFKQTNSATSRSVRVLEW